MTAIFLHLHDDEGEDFYVRADQINAIGTDLLDEKLTTLLVGNEQRLCRQSVEEVIDAISAVVLEI